MFLPGLNFSMNDWLRNIKLFRICIILLLIYGRTYGQTSIAPFVGYDYAEFKTHKLPIEERYYTFQILDHGFSARSPLLGVEISQFIGPRFDIVASLSFVRKSIRASEWSILGLTGLRFDTYRNSISCNYRLIDNFFIGAGYDYNIMTNFIKIFGAPSPRIKGELPPVDHGLMFNLSYSYKQIILRTYYHKGLKDNSVYGANTTNFLPVNYFGFWIGYRFKVFNAIQLGAKKADCPTF